MRKKMVSPKKSGQKKRRNYWSHASFQKRFIRQITVCVFLGAFISASVVFLAILGALHGEFSDDRFERQIKTFAAVKWVAQSGAFDQSLLQNPEILNRYQKRIYNNLLKVAGQSFSLSMLLVLPGMVGVGILMSHRMVGGISRIETYLQKIRKGEFHETLVCREGDEIQPLVESLSAIDRNYLRRLKLLKISAEKIRETTRVLKSEIHADGKIKLLFQEQESALIQIEKMLKTSGI